MKFYLVPISDSKVGAAMQLQPSVYQRLYSSLEDHKNSGPPQMTTSTAIPLAYRCTKCWQVTTANSDQIGQSVPCICCASPMEVPAADEKNLKAGEEFVANNDSSNQPKLELGNQNLSDEEIAKLAKATVEKQIREQAVQDGAFAILSCSRWKRFFGAIIDSVAGFVSVLVGLFLAMALGSVGGENPDPTVFLVVMLVPLMFAVCQLYMIAVDGRTVGKYCVKSKIVNLQGHPPGFFQGIVMRIIVVGFLGLIPFFGLVNACWIFNEPKRCLHDYIAGTFVIDA